MLQSLLKQDLCTIKLPLQQKVKQLCAVGGKALIQALTHLK